MAQLGIYYFNGTSFSTASAIYTNATLTTLAPDGFYSNAGIVRQQLNGILLNAQSCDSCAVACGDGVTASVNNQNGWFQAQVDLANSTGAVILRCFLGGSIPDGVLVTYNTGFHNRLTAKDNHNGVVLVDGTGATVDYAGQNNQGTQLPTYVGNQNAGLVGSYTTTPSGACSQGDKPQDYSFTSGAYVAQGTFQSVTVTNNQVGFATDASTIPSPVFTLVFPKTGATPTLAGILFAAPLCGTAFRWEVDCPTALPSFTASGATNGIPNCGADSQTLFFARNATGPTLPFTVDTNTTPNVGNFVFTTSNGSTYLNDTATIQYYSLQASSSYIGVRRGVVVSSGNCITP
tara:strand:+ start:5622 stop:6662 length:1041 start_codon:yes stop_codon:yes gene_type:complete